MSEADAKSGNASGIALADVIHTLQTALAIVRQKTRSELNVILTKVEVQLKLEWIKEQGTGLGGKLFWVIPIEAGATRSSNTTHNLTLTLRPVAAAASLGETEAEDLATAIIDLVHAAMDIRVDVARDFDLEMFAIAVDVGVTKSGKFQVVASGGGLFGQSHQINMQFRPGARA